MTRHDMLDLAPKPEFRILWSEDDESNLLCQIVDDDLQILAEESLTEQRTVFIRKNGVAAPFIPDDEIACRELVVQLGRLPRPVYPLETLRADMDERNLPPAEFARANEWRDERPGNGKTFWYMISSSLRAWETRGAAVHSSPRHELQWCTGAALGWYNVASAGLGFRSADDMLDAFVRVREARGRVG
ncbi:hypothetical protein F4859DRAFT_517097 [Xylaria cf. heliscus]|nr:hypothetical protein F4859DRAFT_517097 [Xylaria cf. heliscus]